MAEEKRSVAVSVKTKSSSRLHDAVLHVYSLVGQHDMILHLIAGLERDEEVHRVRVCHGDEVRVVICR